MHFFVTFEQGTFSPLFLQAKGWNKEDIPSIKRQMEKHGPTLPWCMLAELNSNARQKAIA